jgi:glycosyltransferase involved in cell wall biosynthesis
VFHDRILIEHGIWGRLVASRADIIIAISGAVAAKGVNAGRSSLRLIPDGVDVDSLKPPAGRTHDGDKSIRYLGRISVEKGLHNLVECAPMVLRTIPDARFVIGGEPFTRADREYMRSIGRKIESKGLARSFEFAGHIDGIRQFLGEAEVFVLPSQREALGIALLEAMALEKPVVATRAGGPEEIVCDGENGRLVDRGDHAGLASAVVDLLRDRVGARRLGSKARETVISRFEIKNVVGRLMNLYEEIRPD